MSEPIIHLCSFIPSGFQLRVKQKALRDLEKEVRRRENLKPPVIFKTREQLAAEAITTQPIPTGPNLPVFAPLEVTLAVKEKPAFVADAPDVDLHEEARLLAGEQDVVPEEKEGGSMDVDDIDV